MEFIADEMLGKLATWLRILGYDTLYPRPTTDSLLVTRALKERRIILTRDTRLIERKHMPRYILIKSDNYNEQLKQVIEELSLKPDQNKWFSRCLLCNTEIQPIPKSDVKTKVPEYTYKTHEEFFLCPDCGRVYWSGTHIQNVEEKLKWLKGGRK